MTEKILLVDDNKDLLDSLRRALFGKYDITTISEPLRALEVLKDKGPFALCISDMKMPNMNGIDFLSEIKKRDPLIVRVMLTGNLDHSTPTDAINKGEVFKFLQKPICSEQLELTIKEGLQKHKELEAEHKVVAETVLGVIKLAGSALLVIDPDSSVHRRDMIEMIKKITNYYDYKFSTDLMIATSLCTFGIITIPEKTRKKWRCGERLNLEEQKLINNLRFSSSELIMNIPRLQNSGQIIIQSTKPYSLIKNEDTFKEASILKVAFDVREKLFFNPDLKTAFLAILENREDYNLEVLIAFSRAYNLEIPSLEEKVINTSNSSSKDTNINDKPKEKTLKEIKVIEIEIGDIVAKDILANNDVRLMSAGEEVDLASKSRLINYNKFSSISEPIYVFNK